MKLLNRQTRAVLRVYTSAWLSWAVLALYLVSLFLVFALSSQSVQLAQTIGFANQWNVISWYQRSKDMTGVTRMAINTSASEMDEVLQPGSALRIAGGTPRLKQLIIYGPITESQLILLLEHQQLESLSITYLDALSPAGWEAVSRQPLKSLDILGNGDHFWDDVEFPTSLETLILRHMMSTRPPEDQTDLKPLLKLTRLRTLQLALWSREDGGLRKPDQDVLSQLPSLRQFYVNSYWPLNVVSVQSEMPKVSVRPGTYESGRVSKVQVLMILMLLPLGLILHVISMQFATPASKLVPGFNSPHFRAAGALLLLFILVQSLALILARCSPLSAVSLAVAVCLPAYLVTLLLNLNGNFPGYVHLILTGPLIVLTVAGIGLATAMEPAEFDWLLQGHRPDVTVTLFALGLLSAIGLARFFLQLPRSLAQGTSGAVPFEEWDLRAFQRWQMEGRPAAMSNQGAKIWSFGQRRRLQKAIRCPKKSPRHQALLWRASQMFTAVDFLIYMASVMSGMALFGYLFTPRQTPVYVFPMVVLFQVIAFSTFSPCLILQMQRPHFVQHLLMTIGRREWVRLIFRETARDFLPTAGLAAIGLLIRHFWNPVGLWPTWHLAILSAGCLVLIFAVQMILMTYPVWIQFLTGCVTSLAFIFGCAIVIETAKGQAAAQAPGVFYWPATWWCMALILAALALRFAYHRWMTWELARIGG